MKTLSRPAWQRVLPFVAFMAVLALRGYAPADDRWGFDTRWLYALTLPLVGGLLWNWRRDYTELSARLRPTWTDAAAATAVGLGVCALWVWLDAPWMQLGSPSASFVPVDAGGALLWPLIAVRAIGATLLVPVMEELFWRSYLLRWIENPHFEAVDPRHVGVKAVLLSTGCFMLAHPQWLAAIIAGLAYAGLYRHSGKLWTAVLAHAVTNGALALWVVSSRQWQFW